MRIAVVNRSREVVEILRKMIHTIPEYKVSWVAYDGAHAIAKCADDVPDLILMGLDMPVVGGVEAVYKIMKSTPCAILIMTGNVSENSSKVFEAMGHGALDVVCLPESEDFNHSCELNDIIKKIEIIRKLLGKKNLKSKNDKKKDEDNTLAFKKKLPPLLVIGASTGGPIALAKILSKFPKDIPFATIIVQHVGEEFSKGLAKWLGEQCILPVEVVKNGMEPEAGKILLAGTSNHLILSENLQLRYTPVPLERPYRPSVDTFFHSVAQYWPEKGMAIILTGMGDDGARGMKALHDLEWTTIAQNQKSCVVFGMPKAVIDLGAATEILAVEQMASKILFHFKMNSPKKENKCE